MYPQVACDVPTPPPTLMTRLIERRKMIREQRLKLNRLDVLLEKNPELKETLQLITELQLNY